MPSRRFLASLLVCSSLLAAGCGSDDPVETTAGPTSTTAQSSADVPENGAPADDGGKLCDALMAWSDAYPTAEPTAAAAGQAMTAAATGFTDEVLPSVPADLRESAIEFQTAMAAAGESLAGYADPEASAEEAYASGLLAPLNSFMMLTMTRVGTSLDDPEGTETTVYDNLFVAWLADPCGPKPLEAEGTPDFQPVGDSI